MIKKLFPLVVLVLVVCNKACYNFRKTDEPTYTVLCEPTIMDSRDYHGCYLVKDSPTHFGLRCHQDKISWFDKKECHVFPESDVKDPKTLIGGGK